MFALLATLWLTPTAQAQVPPQPFSASADPLFSIGVDQTRDLRIRLKMAKDTKIYVDMVAIEVKDPAGLTVGEVELPEGKPFTDPFTEQDRPVYSEPVVLELPITGPEKRGRYELVIDVMWQGCSKSTCYPPSGEVLTVPVRVTKKPR